MTWSWWLHDRWGLVRRHAAPGALGWPEIWVDGAWRRAPASVLDAITGMGEDAWSSGDAADPIDASRAAAIAQAHGVDIDAPPAS